METAELFDAQAQRLLRVLSTIPDGIRMDLWEGQLSIMRMRDFRYRPPYTMVHGEATDEPSEVVRQYARKLAAECRLYEEDDKYPSEWRSSWIEWAQRVEEELKEANT